MTRSSYSAINTFLHASNDQYFLTSFSPARPSSPPIATPTTHKRSINVGCAITAKSRRCRGLCGCGPEAWPERGRGWG